MKIDTAAPGAAAAAAAATAAKAATAGTNSSQDSRTQDSSTYSYHVLSIDYGDESISEQQATKTTSVDVLR